MVGEQAKLDDVKPKQNLICNFRAPNMDEFTRWKQFVQWAKDNGMDVCHLTLSLTDAFMAGQKGAAEVRTSGQVVNIQQVNNFQYQVQKPRREPFSISCVKEEYQRTLSSVLFEAYVLNKSREITRDFSYMDFLELKHDAFRRIVVRLKRKGKVIANPQRSCPQSYYLTEKLQQENSDWSTTQ